MYTGFQQLLFPRFYPQNLKFFTADWILCHTYFKDKKKADVFNSIFGDGRKKNRLLLYLKSCDVGTLLTFLKIPFLFYKQPAVFHRLFSCVYLNLIDLYAVVTAFEISGEIFFSKVLSFMFSCRFRVTYKGWWLLKRIHSPLFPPIQKQKDSKNSAKLYSPHVFVTSPFPWHLVIIVWPIIGFIYDTIQYLFFQDRLILTHLATRRSLGRPPKLIQLSS